jgi:ankyrin repeat protein
MIRPDVLASERPYGLWGSRACDAWDMFLAAENGDVKGLRLLLERDSNLARAEYWYTPPLRIAVREGHAEATKIRLDAFDLVRLGEDDEVVRRVAANPAAALSGCGGVFTAACKLGKRDLLVRLLEAGARVPPVLTECRSYLMSDPGMLRLLLASGMNPDLPKWQRQTPLHDLPRPSRPAAGASRGMRRNPARRRGDELVPRRRAPLDPARVGGEEGTSPDRRYVAKRGRGRMTARTNREDP